MQYVKMSTTVQEAWNHDKPKPSKAPTGTLRSARESTTSSRLTAKIRRTTLKDKYQEYKTR